MCLRLFCDRMPRVRIIHWKPEEAAPLVQACRQGGMEAEYDTGDVSGAAVGRALRQNPPDVVVIDLSRLPSHGREIAVWMRSVKATRHIPIVFVNGEAEKVEKVREILPDAAFTTTARVRSAVAAACRKRVQDPVQPPTMMERFKTRTAAEKLGIKEGSADRRNRSAARLCNRDWRTAEEGHLTGGSGRHTERDAVVCARSRGAQCRFAEDARSGRQNQTLDSVAQGIGQRDHAEWRPSGGHRCGPGGLQDLFRRWALERHSLCAEKMTGPILHRNFYQRAAVDVARDLLGTILVHGETAGMIVETEAYLGGDDLASHSAAGITDRTRVIFGPPGHAYVYLSYGIHECLNIVAEPEGVPGCVLIRALEPLMGLDIMRSRRPGARTDRDLTSGPGKLTRALAITRADNGADSDSGGFDSARPVTQTNRRHRDNTSHRNYQMR